MTERDIAHEPERRPAAAGLNAPQQSRELYADLTTDELMQLTGGPFRMHQQAAAIRAARNTAAPAPSESMSHGDPAYSADYRDSPGYQRSRERANAAYWRAAAKEGRGYGLSRTRRPGGSPV